MQVDYEEIETDSAKRSISIPFKQDASEITISGTYIVPEFSALAPLLLAVIMIGVITAVGMRARLVR
jgi:hypothetical protein